MLAHVHVSGARPGVCEQNGLGLYCDGHRFGEPVGAYLGADDDDRRFVGGAERDITSIFGPELILLLSVVHAVVHFYCCLISGHLDGKSEVALLVGRALLNSGKELAQVHVGVAGHTL